MNRGTFNAFKPEFPNRFISAPQALPAANTPIAVGHGLGVVPGLVTAVLVCVLSEQNWQLGDVIPVTNCDNGTNQFTLSADAQNVRFVYSAAPVINNKTTGARIAITLANWKMVFTAWL